MVPFESTLERDFLSLMASQPSLVRVEAQPFTIPWFDGQRWRRYTPDFKVELSIVPKGLAQRGFALTTIVEVKYAAKSRKRSQNP